MLMYSVSKEVLIFLNNACSISIPTAYEPLNQSVLWMSVQI